MFKTTAHPTYRVWLGVQRSQTQTGLFIAMRDAWLAGMALMENVSRQSMAGDNPGAGCSAANLLGPVNSVLGAMADLAAANRPRLDRPDAGAARHSAPSGQHDPLAADFLLPMSQAMMIGANRSISYWLGLARIFESHQMTLAQMMLGQVMDVTAIDGGAAASERLLAADKLRALLREVGDLAAREARTLQNELSALDESLVQIFQQPDLTGPYRRRWRAKV
jgi:hypothetical protein